MMLVSGAIWLAVAAGVVFVAGVVRTWGITHNTERPDVGAVSDQWLAAHRASSTDGISR